MLELADGKVSLVAVRAFEAGRGRARDPVLAQPMPHVDTRVAAIFRGDSPIAPEGRPSWNPATRVFSSPPPGIRHILRELRRMDRGEARDDRRRRHIGRRLAMAIEDRYEVKIIERGKSGAERLAAELDRTLVLSAT